MSARHRHARTTRPDRDESRLPLVVLLLLGMAGPAWTLRDPVAELVTETVREAVSVTVPDVARPAGEDALAPTRWSVPGAGASQSAAPCGGGMGGPATECAAHRLSPFAPAPTARVARTGADTPRPGGSPAGSPHAPPVPTGSRPGGRGRRPVPEAGRRPQQRFLPTGVKEKENVLCLLNSTFPERLCWSPGPVA